ncbi:anhydro-N-acetylmuramic acid kinase [bacterium]|nr:anhydro-N-acetylmuramic acid kinase [bacterium]
MLKSSLFVVGVMSGTSFDGVDCALCKINPDLSFEFLKGEIFNYHPLIKKEIFKLIKGNGTIKELCSLNFVLGEFYADCVFKLCENANFDIKKLDLISSHGQTVFHNPTNNKFCGYSENSTLQIGELSCIAKKTGIITVGDFRPCDMALSGQGAPLIPFFDKLLFSKTDKNVALQNLGGIANVTILGKNGEFLAFDNAPANALIDLAMQKFYNKPFDKNGEIGLSADYNKELLDFMQSYDKFLTQKPPKSTGKEYYSERFLEDVINFKKLPHETLIATLSAYTGFAIAKSLRDFSSVKIDEIILSGGGVKNQAIVKYIKDFSKINVSFISDFGVSDDFKEAIAFAILGYQRYFEQPNNEPKATGAKKQTTMGKIVLP